MKKTIYTLICLFSLIFVVGCSSDNDSNSMKFPEDSGSSEFMSIPTEGPYARRTADWKIYNNAEELISDADLIFIGKVTDIEFQVLDITNSLPVSESTPDYAKELYTIYSVDVITSYKGDTTNISKVRVMGGMVDYKVDEQLEIMNRGESFKRDLGIPIWDNFYKAQCNEDEYYLFVLCQFDTGYPTILNLEQAVYNLKWPTKKHTVGSNTNVYYSGDKDEYNNPLISAFDIISAFGTDYLETFYQNWSDGKYTDE